MSRTRAERACPKCGWNGLMVEDTPYNKCPDCGQSMTPRPIKLTAEQLKRVGREPEPPKSRERVIRP